MEQCNNSSCSLFYLCLAFAKNPETGKIRPNADIITSTELHTAVDLIQDCSLKLYILWDKVISTHSARDHAC